MAMTVQFLIHLLLLIYNTSINNAKDKNNYSSFAVNNYSSFAVNNKL